MSTRPPPSGLRRPQVLHACWRGRPWLLPLPRPSNRRVPRLKEPSPLRLRIQASPPLGLGLPPHSSTSRVFLPPLEAVTASTEKEPRNPTPALVGLTQRAALGSPLCHPFRGKSGEEAAFQNRRTVHPGEWVGSCSSLLWTTPLHLPRGEAAAPEQAGRPVPSSTRCQPSAPLGHQGGPEAQAPVRRRRLCPSTPSASTSPLLWPCPWSGGTPLPLAWALLSPAMAPQQKSSGMPPTAPPALQQAPPLSGFLPGAPDTPNPTAYHGCCFHNPPPISHQGT